MPITPTSPIQINNTCDTFWLPSIILNSPTVNGECNATLLLLPYNSSSGLSSPQNMLRLDINGLMGRIIGGDMALATIFSQLITYVQNEYNNIESVAAQVASTSGGPQQWYTSLQLAQTALAAAQTAKSS